MNYPPQQPNQPGWGQPQGGQPGGQYPQGGGQPGGPMPPQGPPPGGQYPAGGPQQPGFGPPGWPDPMGGGQPPKKKNTGLIVAIVVIAVVLLGGGVTTALVLTLGGDDKQNTSDQAGDNGGGGGGEEQQASTPQETVDAYAALAEKTMKTKGQGFDEATASEILCQEMLDVQRGQKDQLIEQAAKHPKPDDPYWDGLETLSYEPSNIQVNGDSGTFDLEMMAQGQPQQKGTLTLNKEGGTWKVCSPPDQGGDSQQPPTP